MQDIIRVLFFNDEEDLACYLTAFYEVYVDEDLLKTAIAMDKYKWLNYLWVFKKNQLRHKKDGVKDLEKVTIPYSALFGHIDKVVKQVAERKPKDEMKKVCEWLIPYDQYYELQELEDKEIELESEKIRIAELKQSSKDDNIL